MNGISSQPQDIYTGPGTHNYTLLQSMLEIKEAMRGLWGQVDGCSGVAVQWQSTGGSNQKPPGFDSR